MTTTASSRSQSGNLMLSDSSATNGTPVAVAASTSKSSNPSSLPTADESRSASVARAVLTRLLHGAAKGAEDAATVVLIVAATALCIACLALDATHLVAVTDHHRNQLIAARAANVLQAFAVEVANGTTAISEAERVALLRTTDDSLASLFDVKGSSEATERFSFMRTEIDSIRGALSSSAAAAAAAMTSQFPQLAHRTVEAQVSLLSDGTLAPSKAQLGLLCYAVVADELLRHMSLLDAPQRMWRPAEFFEFLSSLGDDGGERLLRVCHTQLLQTSTSSPSLPQPSDWTVSLGPPSPAFATTPPPPTDSALQAARVASTMSFLHATLMATTRELQDAHDDERQSLISMVAVASVAVAIAGAVLAMTVTNILRFKSSETSLTDIRARFKNLEVKAKLLPRYQNVLATGSVREADVQLRAAHSDTFLHRLVDFVQRLRPYLPQSVFGEIEHVSMAGSKFASRAIVSTESASPEQAIRELHLRDLRLDVGMQLVSGSVLFISLCNLPMPFGNPSEMSETVSSFASTVERIVNGASGIIHCFAGDSVIALWNVTSSTPNPHFKSTFAAMMIARAHKKVGMGIAHGPMIAGNVSSSSRNVLHVVGPAMTFAEKFEGYGTTVGSNVVLDTTTAEALQSVEVVDDEEYCIRPAVIIPVRDEHDEPIIGHAVFRYRVRSQKAKAWAATFRDVVSDYSAKRWGMCIDHITKFQTAQQDSKRSKGDPLVGAWLALLRRRLEHSERKASEVPQM